MCVCVHAFFPRLRVPSSHRRTCAYRFENINIKNNNNVQKIEFACVLRVPAVFCTGVEEEPCLKCEILTWRKPIRMCLEYNSLHSVRNRITESINIKHILTLIFCSNIMPSRCIFFFFF